MKKYIITGLFFLISIIANSQKINRETYPLLKTLFDEIGNENYLPVVDVSLLEYHTIHINYDEVLTKEFFKNALYIGKIHSQPDTVLFGEEDFKKMKNEVKQYRFPKSLNKNKLRKYDILHTGMLLKPSTKIVSYYRVCHPVYSANKNIALIYLEEFCKEGCGGGELYIMKKSDDGKWFFYTAIQIWIT